MIACLVFFQGVYAPHPIVGSAASGGAGGRSVGQSVGPGIIMNGSVLPLLLHLLFPYAALLSPNIIEEVLQLFFGRVVSLSKTLCLIFSELILSALLLRATCPLLFSK